MEDPTALSPLTAGVFLLFILAAVISGTTAACLIANRAPNSIGGLFILGAMLILIGSVFCTFNHSQHAHWIAEVLLGFGFGIVSALTNFIQNQHVTGKILPASFGWLMGGTFGVAICSTIRHNEIIAKFPNLKSPDLIIEEPSPAMGKVFDAIYIHQFLVLTIVAAVNMIVSVLLSLCCRVKA